MGATGALSGLVLALLAGGVAQAGAIDSRTALFDAAFAHRPAGTGAFSTVAAPPRATTSAFAALPPSPHAVALDQPAYLTAADEGGLDFGDAVGRTTLSVTSGAYEFSFVPRGAVDAGGGGASAQAGAMVRVGADLQGRVMDGLNRLGVRTVSSAALENRGRLYLFAAYSGREVGLNIARGAQGGFQRLGWSAEGASTLVSDAQAGFGWRRGGMQASVGYVHRDVNSNDMGFGNVGIQKLSDNMVAFTLSVHPR